MKKRIWELDAARGLALIGMVLIHLHYDAVELYGLWDWNPGWYQLFKNNYGAIFLLISGISATLGSRPVKRGLLRLAEPLFGKPGRISLFTSAFCSAWAAA